MKSEYNYKCSLCGHEYDTQEIIYTCPRDSGNLDVILDYSHIREALSPDQIKKSREPSIWRYLALLPIGEPIGAGTPLHSVGWTPVYSPDSLSEKLDLRDLFIKDESPNPTASFKDRASAVVVAKAIEIGKEVAQLFLTEISQVNNIGEYKKVVIEPELIIRESSLKKYS